MDVFGCIAFGLVAGLIIGYVTEVMTSYSYKYVQELAASCKTGAATNVIYGLALGYLSTIIPVTVLCLVIYYSHSTLGYYGIALSALGMLSNLPICLAIDGYGPISDNAGGIAEMSELAPIVRERTDILDSAGNTTAAIGKGFAIGSALLVGFALYGAFMHTCYGFGSIKPGEMSFDDPMIFTSLLFGAMIPYAFSALTMKSVGLAALGMIAEVRRQIREHPGILDGTERPNYTNCVKISTQASLKEMLLPGLLVKFTIFRSLLPPSLLVTCSDPRLCWVSSLEPSSAESRWPSQPPTPEELGTMRRSTLKLVSWSRTE
jgi:H+-translocating diphosphatase